MKRDIKEVRDRIVANEGKIFYLVRGGEFNLKVKGNLIVLSRTNRSVAKSVFEEALEFVPLENTTPLQLLQAPSYLYAILTDERIKYDLW